MEVKTFTFRILRFKPGHIDPPRYQHFELEVRPHMTVLDCLEKIRLQQDNTLMYRHSCHHSSCGTCACRINGEEKLACTTRVHKLGVHKVTLAPLKEFTRRGDLVVDMEDFFKDLSEKWTYLRDAAAMKTTRMPPGIQRFTRFENCIECGACVSACPANHKNKNFMGPAGLSAIHNEIMKTPQKEKELLSLAGKKQGVNLCESALNCSRVCPTSVYPARHISDLRRLLVRKESKRNSISE